MLDQTRRTYFSPDDDCLSALVAFVSSAKREIRIADYSFNYAPIVDALIAQHRAGVDVRLILDKSQAGGKSEIPEIQTLRDAGVPLVVGTSERHRIMHHKFCVVDKSWVLAGSFNFTKTAELENNYFDVEHSPDRAAIFLRHWQGIWDWVSTHAPQ